jgi:hypothetical protein
MARKMTKAAKHVDPEDESQEVPEAQPRPSAEPRETAVSKGEAARAALAEGVESPTEAAEFIKKKFGIEMSPQHFSSIKFQLKQRGGQAPTGKRGRRRKSAQPVESYLAPPPKLPAPGGGDVLDSLEVLKPLIAEYGADRVKRMVDLLGRETPAWDRSGIQSQF